MTLFNDLLYVLKSHGYLTDDVVAEFSQSRDFLTLHVVATLHGTDLVVANKDTARLTATYSAKSRLIGLKAVLTFNDLEKPFSTSVFLFHTGLTADEHYSPSLLAQRTWEGKPLDVGQDGRLVVLN